MSIVREAIAELLRQALKEAGHKDVDVAASLGALRAKDETADAPRAVVVLLDARDCADDAASATLAEHAGCVVPCVLGAEPVAAACADALGDPFVCAQPVVVPLAVAFPRSDGAAWLAVGCTLPPGVPANQPLVVVHSQPGVAAFAQAFTDRAEREAAAEDKRPFLVVLGSGNDEEIKEGPHVARAGKDAPLPLPQTLALVQRAVCYLVLDSKMPDADKLFEVFAAMASAERGTAVVCPAANPIVALAPGATIAVSTDKEDEEVKDALFETMWKVACGKEEDQQQRRTRMDAGLGYVRTHQSASEQRHAVGAVCARAGAVVAKLRFATGTAAARACYGYAALRGRHSLGVDRLALGSFARVLRAGTTYLDHVGAALYAAEQVRATAALLLDGVLANPHSNASAVDGLARNPAIRTANAVRAARAETLAFLGTDPAAHTAVFTAGATAALKLVGECFAWSRDSVLCYLHDNHNSALGIREYARAAGVPESAVRTFDDAAAFLAYARATLAHAPHAQHLAVLPLQGNFDGARHSTAVVAALRRLQAEHEDARVAAGSTGFRVLLDAAAWVPHSALDLRAVAADYTCLSFYKVFGLPTGLGALVLRNDTALRALAHKTYFGGGTVSVSLQDTCHHVLRDTLAERFEDGTVSFLDIAALHCGFDALRRLVVPAPSPASTTAISSTTTTATLHAALDAIDRHTALLTRHLAKCLLGLRHTNGQPVCVLAGDAHKMLADAINRDKDKDEKFNSDEDDDQDMKELEEYMRLQGPVVAFNVRRSDGVWVGPSTVGTLAALCGIQLRTGCTCNPRACQRFLGLSDAAVLRNAEAGRVCWADDLDVVDGVPTGAVRVSLGYGTRHEDVARLVAFLDEQFVDRHRADDVFPRAPAQALAPSVAAAAESAQRTPLAVAALYVYPIKSCSGCSVTEWEIGANGALRHDREWAIVDADGRTLTQKQQPRLCFVQPAIDPAARTLVIRARGMPDISIPLPEEEEEEEEEKKEKEKTPKETPQGEGGEDEQVMMCGIRKPVKSAAADLARVSAWFSEFLGIACSFVQAASMPRAQKPGSGPGNGKGVQGSFLNSANFLVCSEASFEDLAARLEPAERDGVDMLSFRPNILVRGTSVPFAEDRWRAVQVGPHVLASVRLCDRCVLTCVDRRTARIAREPLHTLAKYRHFAAAPPGAASPVRHGGILFGHLMDRVASSTGRPWRLEVSARVVVLDEYPPEAVAPSSSSSSCSCPSASASVVFGALDKQRP